MENYSNETTNQVETFNQPNDSAAHAAEFQPPAAFAGSTQTAADKLVVIAAADSQPTIAESETSAIVPAVLYDANAEQRFPFTLNENGEAIETAHIFQPISDERHLRYVVDVIEVRDGIKTGKTLNQLSVELWRELVVEIENLEVEAGADFRDVPDEDEEILPLLFSYLTVAVKPPTVAKAKRSPVKVTQQTICTQAYFNGEVIDQVFVLQAKSDEWRKKYNRIERAQYKENPVKGTKDAPQIVFVPQHNAKAALFDEMLISATGFQDDSIPMRFKIVALDEAFKSSVVEAKK